MNRPPLLLLVLPLLLGGVALWLSVRAPTPVTATDGGMTPILSYPDAFLEPTIPPPPQRTGAAPLAAAALTTLAPSALLATWQVADDPPQLADTRGHWVAEGDRISQQGMGRAASLSPTITTLMSPDSYGDVTVSAAFYDTRNGTVGLIARQSVEGAYRVWLHAAPTFDGEALVVERVVAGVTTPLLTDHRPPLYERRGWHTLELSITGGRLLVALDGITVAEAIDPTPLPAGRVGLLTRALGGISFGAVTVTGRD